MLVYLGFLNSEEMRDRGNPFARHEDWEALVRSHSRSICPDQVWGGRLEIGGIALIPLIRSRDVSLSAPPGLATGLRLG